MMQLGQDHGDHRLVMASRELYVHALQQIMGALNRPSLAVADETLATAILLGAYEMVNATGQQAWMLHSRGVACLLVLRGAQAHATGLGRTLMLSFRGFIVFDALMKGERCFLEAQEWREIIPEGVQEEERRGQASRLGELIEYAFHEIAHCPGFLAETRAMVASTHASKTDRAHLTRRIMDCRQKLSEIQLTILTHLNSDNRGEFIGMITAAAANTLGGFSLEGIGSGISFLQQLLTVLTSNASRRHASRQRPWATVAPYPFQVNVPAFINAQAVAKAIADGKHTHQPPGPQTIQRPDTWFDRVSMSMGMVEEMPPT
ncbi:uncharacterized protein N7482_010093 [Penicillium canariense]|uniref:Uncharacterized protein n=1 Tax=Penicillium canariense TaxID=189055 RepID=A0A9W9HLU0_9EURO|nr:uncharacterized protein N7482_010093 [Penicillium canariense]KAJ5150841.1 hypothetical protein N7482_010093 [Penicillium canariense]